MKLSREAKELLKSMEGLRLTPYNDQNGKPTDLFIKGATIGYGHLITTQREFNDYYGRISERKADELLDYDLMLFENNLNKVNKKPNLKQNEFDAMLLLSFNIGIGNFNSSSVLRMNNGIKTHYPTIESAFLAWNKSQGRVLEGLKKRRLIEADMYTKGIYRAFR